MTLTVDTIEDTINMLLKTTNDGVFDVLIQPSGSLLKASAVDAVRPTPRENELMEQLIGLSLLPLLMNQAKGESSAREQILRTSKTFFLGGWEYAETGEVTRVIEQAFNDTINLDAIAPEVADKAAEIIYEGNAGAMIEQGLRLDFKMIFFSCWMLGRKLYCYEHDGDVLAQMLEGSELDGNA